MAEILVHNIEMTVFVKEEDDPDKVRSVLQGFFPFDLEEAKVPVFQKKADGFEGKKIIVLRVELMKQKHVKIFLENLLGKLSAEQKNVLINQKETRLDEDLDFFIRFDKPKLLAGDGELSLTDKGNCFHLRMKIAAFPAKRENALETIEKIFKP